MRELLMIGAALTALTAGCSGGSTTSSTGTGSGTGTGSSTGTSSASGGSTGTQYNTLSGTFTAPGLSATFVGAVQGTYSSSSSVDPSNDSTWTALDRFADPAAQFPTVTVTTPAGDTGQVQLSVSIAGPPTAGVHTCGDPSGIVLLYLPNGNVLGGYGNYVDGGCTVTLQAPTLVSSQTLGNGGQLGTYFAHGSVSATLLSYLPDGGVKDTGTLAATW